MAHVRDAFHKIGPLLPASLDQALSWLGKRAKRQVGFEHSLARVDDGGVVVRRKGQKLPEQAFLPAKVY